MQAPVFDGSSISFIEFVEEFMRFAEYNRWDEKDTMFHLWNSIVGNAKIRVKTMPDPTSLNIFLKELLSVFYNERTFEAYRNQLANVQRTFSMDLESYGYYLLDLARKAHPLAVAQEQETIAIDCFFKTAGSVSLHVWLKALNPRTLKDTIDLAIQHKQAMRSPCSQSS